MTGSQLGSGTGLVCLVPNDYQAIGTRPLSDKYGTKKRDDEFPLSGGIPKRVLIYPVKCNL